MTLEAAELGIVSPDKRISAHQCMKQMQVRVMLPALFLVVVAYGGVIGASFALGVASLRIETITSLYPNQVWKLLAYTILFGIALLPLLPTWLWLNRATQKWRIWALQNVDSWPKLEKECESKSGRKWPRKQISQQATVPQDRILEQKLIAYRDCNDLPL